MIFATFTTNIYFIKSLVTYFILVISLIIFSFTYYPKYKQGGGEATISWDVSGYYWYLPGAFIYKDLKNLHFSDSLREAYSCSADNQQITYLPDGKKTLKYSSGMAVQYLPFFLIAHSIAKPLGFPADGLSEPYQLAIHIGALLICLLGLWYLRKFLLNYFKDSTVAITLFLLVVGTNYLDYAAIDLGMTHSWLFTWYCLLLYYSDTYYKNPKLKYALLIGAILGIMALTRPTEILAIIIPILWGTNVFNRNSIKSRVQFILKNLLHYLSAIAGMILIGSIQLLYWKYATGHWLVYSYGDQEFSWLHPHVFLFTTSWRCGWLVYCPLMTLPILGFLFLFKRKELFGTTFIFFCLFFWVVTAWDIWSYGGRAMIQGYPILMIPFASLIEFSLSKKWITVLFSGLAFIGVYLNIWWVHGVHEGKYVYATDMSEAYYKKIVGQWHINEQDRKLLDVSDDFIGTPTQIEILVEYKFNTNQEHEIIYNGKNVYLLENYRETTFSLPFKKSKQISEWIRASADIQCMKQNWDILRMSIFGVCFYKNGNIVKENRILLDRLFYKDSIQRIYIDNKIKSNEYDSSKVYFHNSKEVNGTFFISNLKVESFN